jgi:hypothetical protein
MSYDSQQTESPEPAENAQEAADCKAWLLRIEEAREFDKAARKQYAIDRKYARGDSGQFEVDVPIAATYVDILASFLYAKDPDVDCLPSEAAGPARLEDARMLGKTLEVVIRRLWRKAKLKQACEPMVRSSITTGVGWIKAAWLERVGDDPVIRQEIGDIQDNLRRIKQTTAEVESGESPKPDEQAAELEQQLQALEAKVEVVLARGLGIDWIQAEDVQVAPGVPSIGHYIDAPWIAHRTFMSADDAKADYPAIAEKLKHATTFYQNKPVDPTVKRDTGLVADVSETDADSHRSGTNMQAGTEACVCVWEVQSRERGVVLTLVEGLHCYARPPAPPNPGTSRFYSLFLWAPGIVDGDRHPRSLISRSARLFDEYNRVRSNYATHRRRSIPKTGFDATNLSEDEAKKLEAGGTGEMIGLKPLRPGEPIGNLLAPIQYNPVDQSLYDTSVIRTELEMLWGIQEALSSSINTAKTATEAELMQQGTMARISYRRDSLEGLLTDLAQYTGEVALQKCSHEDVVNMAGPEAYWPQGLTVEELDLLVAVEIRAGTTGKPDTVRQREAWATIMPMLQTSIMQIGQLRGSSPLDIAECFEELVAETLARTGERIDADRFLPDVPEMIPGMPGMPGAPMGMPQPAGVSNGPAGIDPAAAGAAAGIPAAAGPAGPGFGA